MNHSSKRVRKLPVFGQFLLSGVLAGVAAGCSAGIDEDRSELAPVERVTAVRVDAQVMQDVADATFWTPGIGVRRGIRVRMFVMSIAVAECGGDEVPLESTEDRPAQNLFADLELIRRNGLVEDAGSYRQSLDSRCTDLIPENLRWWDEWRDLSLQWEVLALSLQESSATLSDHKRPMADCLHDRTGLFVDAADPTTFLRAVDTANIRGASNYEMKEFAVAYADCGKEFFDTFASVLENERKSAVERNRGVLTRFAAELAEAGYEP